MKLTMEMHLYMNVVTLMKFIFWMEFSMDKWIVLCMDEIMFMNWINHTNAIGHIGEMMITWIKLTRKLQLTYIHEINDTHES
jgi:hypothetical protein